MRIIQSLDDVRSEPDGGLYLDVAVKGCKQ